MEGSRCLLCMKVLPLQQFATSTDDVLQASTKRQFHTAAPLEIIDDEEAEEY